MDAVKFYVCSTTGRSLPSTSAILLNRWTRVTGGVISAQLETTHPAPAFHGCLCNRYNNYTAGYCSYKWALLKCPRELHQLVTSLQTNEAAPDCVDNLSKISCLVLVSEALFLYLLLAPCLFSQRARKGDLIGSCHIVMPITQDGCWNEVRSHPPLLSSPEANTSCKYNNSSIGGEACRRS